MPAGNLDITIEQGATFKMILTLTDANGDRVDLTGETFRGKVKDTYSSGVVRATFAFTVYDQLIAATRGQVECFISAANTALIPVDPATNYERRVTKMTYDIESENGSSVVTRWLEGTAKISPEVTT